MFVESLYQNAQSNLAEQLMQELFQLFFKIVDFSLYIPICIKI